MDKRTFIKLSSALITGTALYPMMNCKQESRPHNWAGNLEFGTDRVFEPSSVEEVQELIKKYSSIKAQGTRHCFNTIADSTENLLSSKNLNQIIALDKDKLTVTVGAGIRYGELATYLYKEGYALHNLASLPHISVAGACATATHGSGVKNGNLSTIVTAMEIVSGNGERISLSREKDGDQFLGTVTHLGALGVVTSMTLAIQPNFFIRQDIYENLPLIQLEKNLDAIMSAGYSVSLFTDWQNKNVSQVWIKSRVEETNRDAAAPEFFGAKLATRNMHPITALSAENCTDQMGVPGPWHERLPHFKMGFTPSGGVELQSEYFVPREKGYEAMLAVESLGDQIGPHLLISEIRTIQADDLWLSPCYHRDSLAIHFTWKQEWDAVMNLLPQIEEKLRPFDARPHWGKLFTMTPSTLSLLYEKMPDFKNLIAKFDPKGKFENDFLKKNVFGIEN